MRAGREMRAVCPTALKHVVVGPEGHTKTETQYPRPQPVARRLYPKFRRQQPSVFVTGLATTPPPPLMAAHKWAQGMCRQNECLSEFLRLSAVRVNKERVMRGGGVEYKHVASVSHVYGVGKLACLRQTEALLSDPFIPKLIEDVLGPRGTYVPSSYYLSKRQTDVLLSDPFIPKLIEDVFGPRGTYVPSSYYLSKRQTDVLLSDPFIPKLIEDVFGPRGTCTKFVVTMRLREL
ncbi:hypothetical protein J6590_077440 [Homalodisca vitripennis]|nr:hypothetical protein J6590_077440 [Homalodisca vitripennis]